MSNITVKKLHTFLGHNDSLYCLERFDDSRFFSAGSDGMIVMWDLKSPDEGEVIAKINGSVYAMALDSKSGMLYVGENNQGIHKINLETKSEEASVQLGNQQIFDLSIKNDFLLCGLESGELVKLSFDLKVVQREKVSSKRIRNIDSFDSEYAFATSDNTIKILDDSFKEIHTLTGHKKSVFTAKFHPSGKYLISGGMDAQLKVWDTSVDYVLRENIAAHLYTINDLCFSSDGKQFVTCSMDKSIKLWDAYNFKLLKVLDKHRHAGHGNSVNKLLWMKYQDLLVSCSDDRTISVWDIKLEE